MIKLFTSNKPDNMVYTKIKTFKRNRITKFATHAKFSSQLCEYPSVITTNRYNYRPQGIKLTTIFELHNRTLLPIDHFVGKKDSLSLFIPCARQIFQGLAV